MSETERKKYHDYGSLNLLYLKESARAGQAGDDEAAWDWLALCEIPAHSLMFLKRCNGASFIRERGFNTKNAEARYGSDWLDREDPW